MFFIIFIYYFVQFKRSPGVKHKKNQESRLPLSEQYVHEMVDNQEAGRIIITGLSELADCLHRHVDLRWIPPGSKQPNLRGNEHVNGSAKSGVRHDLHPTEFPGHQNHRSAVADVIMMGFDRRSEALDIEHR